jgi:SET domain-containing protein
MKKLVVKKSGLPQAGKGLFTNVFIPKGTRIAEYKGTIIKWKAAKSADKYIFYINRDHVIDAGSSRAFAKYANDAKGLSRLKGTGNNSIYAVEGKSVFIDAVKNIPAGSEILVDYGKEYWDAIRYNLRHNVYE